MNRRRLWSFERKNLHLQLCAGKIGDRKYYIIDRTEGINTEKKDKIDFGALVRII